MHNLQKMSLALATLVVCTDVQAIDLITEGDTTLSIGGSIMVEGRFTSPDNGDSEFEGNMRETRINVETTKIIDNKKLKGFIEGDFYGDYATGGSDLRLRHAFLQYDHFTVGKNWNGQFYSVVPLSTEQLDFWGGGIGTASGSGLNARPDLTIHYANNGLRVTAQDPVYDNANVPDMVVSYSDDIANLGYTFAVTGREVSTGIENSSDSDIGIGASLASKLIVGNGSLHGSVYTGKGMGVYSGVCTGGILTAATINCDAENGDLVSQTGFSVGYRHNFTPKLRGNMRYAEVTVNDDTDTSINIKSANIIYNYWPDLDVGIEWRDRSKTTQPWREKGQEIEIMAKYSF